ncbi:MAG TPA: outer membrane beta-barrel protein [Bryobacteraceae bacterium]|nr:outer membrane beta-barrel protein [Bryobacteraceae bacterium]
MRYWLAFFSLCACATLGYGQSFEVAVSGGVSRFGDTSLGTVSTDPTDAKITMSNGFRLTFRGAFNTWRFFGHEVGFAYNHTSLTIPASTSISTGGLPGQAPAATTTEAQQIGMSIWQGFYDFMAYATPEGTHVRPFVCGGAGFTSFFPPGSSVYYGNQETKFGINYGGGLKVRLNDMWGVRVDYRQFLTPKPFGFPNQSGWLGQTEISAGVSLNM